MRTFAAFLLICLCFQTGNARAYWSTPTAAPVAPKALQPIYILMQGGGCDDLFIDPAYPQVTREGSSIRIAVRTIHQTFAEFCDIPDFTFSTPLGAFFAGSYAVQVDVHYQNIFGLHTDTIGTIPLLVSPAGTNQPLSVPVNALPYLLLLVTGVVLVARTKYDRLVSTMLASCPHGRLPRQPTLIAALPACRRPTP